MPRRIPFRSSPVTIWTVEDSATQVTWGHLPAGPVTVSALRDGREVASRSITIDGGPGALTLERLPPSTALTIRVAWRDGGQNFDIRTAASPPGTLLTKVATVSDLHLGSDHFGFLKQMRHADRDNFAYRSAHAAITEAVDWGADHLVVKGDAAHHGRAEDFAEVGRLVDAFPDLAISLLPGNHDVDMRGGAALPDTVGRRRVPYERHVSHLDFDGIRLVLGNTTVEREGPGTLAVIRSDLLDVVDSADRAVLVAIHQQLQEHNTIRYWPPGIGGHEARSFLDDLNLVTGEALVTSGHTHRNRARRHGRLVVTEVASTHHWPGVWAGYAIHEGGIRQTVRRIGDPQVIPWHEYSKNAVLTVWQRYASGELTHRCIVHPWAGHD